MSAKQDDTAERKELKGIDALFGRDLRVDGWFVKAPDAQRAEQRMGERDEKSKIDPAVIWSMRGRRRR